MARMLHRRGEPAGASQRVFLAVAAYEGLSAGFAYSIAHTTPALVAAGIEFELAVYSGNCHVDDSRNRLVRDFLQGDCTDLFFIDADVGWFPGDLIKLLSYDRDVVAGIYPKKQSDDIYPVKLLPGEVWSDDEGLIEVQGVPTGFLRIRRNVLQTLAERAEVYNAKNDAAYSTPCIFERQTHGGSRWGGDYVFCRKWRELGGRIYIDPALRLEHSGEMTWFGSVGAWLRQLAGTGLRSGLSALRNGNETIEHMIDLRDAWHNPFAAQEVSLAAMAIVARRGGPILECGSGLSTLVMAAAAPHAEVHCLENSPVWAEHLRLEAEKYGLTNVVIHSKPLTERWYDLTGVPDLDWRFVVIDGPRNLEGGRLQTFEQIDMRRAVVIADDVQPDGGMPLIANKLGLTHETVVVEDGGQKSFVVAVPREQNHKMAA